MSGMAERMPEAHAWQKIRQKPIKGTILEPMTGFGPEGGHTLWLASPRRLFTWGFENRQPVLQAGKLALEDPKLEALRDEALISFQPGSGGPAEVGPAFLRYSAALIDQTYQAPPPTAGQNKGPATAATSTPASAAEPLSDEDLSFILSGTKWHAPMLRHILGGDDVVRKLAILTSDQFPRASRAKVSEVPMQPLLPTAGKTEMPPVWAIENDRPISMWRRFLRFLRILSDGNTSTIDRLRN